MEDKVCAKHGKNVFLTKQRPRPVHTTTKKKWSLVFVPEWLPINRLFCKSKTKPNKNKNKYESLYSANKTLALLQKEQNTLNKLPLFQHEFLNNAKKVSFKFCSSSETQGQSVGPG